MFFLTSNLNGKTDKAKARLGTVVPRGPRTARTHLILNISPDALHELVTTKATVVDFLTVDVRRTDVDGRPISNDLVS